MAETHQPIPWWATSFTSGEAEAAAGAITNRHLSQGSITEQFEQALAKHLGVPHVVAVTSGTSALTLALMAHGIGPGDEVLVPNRTWVATAHSVQILGATPVFIDTEPDRPVMDVATVHRHVTSRTKVVIPVHMNGRSVNMEAVNAFAAAAGLVVIEDAAQALGSRDQQGRALGTLSKAGCFSLSVAKIISTGQGGFVATRDAVINARLRAIRTHGVENTIEPNTWIMPGFNFRFTDILASIGLVQLGLLPGRVNRQRQVYDLYEEGLKGSDLVRLIPQQVGEVGPYIEILTKDRDRLVEFLKLRGIETRIFYPDLDTAPYWNFDEGLVNSRVFGREGLYLPSGPSITNEQIERVLAAVIEYR
jgi:dTDP-4-amino-4,6-dideoxygalactose transaminase